MSEPFIGEIRIFAGTYAPVGWGFCDGGLLAIAEHDALFTLIGTIYGGDGQSTFAKPDLRGRVPIHAGNGYVIGEAAGVESVTLTTNQLPAHGHQLVASTDIPTLPSPANAVTGQAARKLYRVPGATAQLNAATIAPVGGSQPHDNMQPYVAIRYIISLFGVYPPPP